MTEFYLILAVFLAFTLNQSSRILRALGTLTAALALVMISWSIILANLDGTFAAIPVGAGLADRIKPFVLNTQAAIAAGAAVFLLWAVWAQGIRRVGEPLPLRNTLSAFGRVSRYAHWVIGTLILVLLPMELFASVLAADHPERGAFLAMHQTLGLTVLLLVVLRVLWLGQSPAPPMQADASAMQRQLARATHLGLYGLMLGFPITGILLTAWRGDAQDIYGWSVTGWPIHLDFGKERKRHAETTVAEGGNFLVGPWLLMVELVAGEGKHRETARRVLRMQRLQPFVLGREAILLHGSLSQAPWGRLA